MKPPTTQIAATEPANNSSGISFNPCLNSATSFPLDAIPFWSVEWKHWCIKLECDWNVILEMCANFNCYSKYYKLSKLTDYTRGEIHASGWFYWIHTCFPSTDFFFPGQITWLNENFDFAWKCQNLILIPANWYGFETPHAAPFWQLWQLQYHGQFATKFEFVQFSWIL